MINNEQIETIKSTLLNTAATIKPLNRPITNLLKSCYPEIKYLIAKGKSRKEIANHFQLPEFEISYETFTIYISAMQYAEFEKLMQWPSDKIYLLLEFRKYPETDESAEVTTLVKLANQSIPEKFEYIQIFRSIFPTIMLLIDRGHSLQQIHQLLKKSWPNEDHDELLLRIQEHYILLIENCEFILTRPFTH